MKCSIFVIFVLILAFMAKPVEPNGSTNGTEITGNIAENFLFDKDFDLFKGMKQGFSATRYHSLIVNENFSDQSPIQITAWTEDKIPMALKIQNKPIVGVQFHPEAILTEDGIEIFRNFLKYY